MRPELALERVAVMRNDLSDDDLVIQPRMEARKKDANPFARGEKAGRAKKAEEVKAPAPVLKA